MEIDLIRNKLKQPIITHFFVVDKVSINITLVKKYQNTLILKNTSVQSLLFNCEKQDTELIKNLLT